MNKDKNKTFIEFDLIQKDLDDLLVLDENFDSEYIEKYKDDENVYYSGIQTAIFRVDESFYNKFINDELMIECDEINFYTNSIEINGTELHSVDSSYYSIFNKDFNGCFYKTEDVRKAFKSNNDILIQDNYCFAIYSALKNNSKNKDILNYNASQNSMSIYDIECSCLNENRNDKVYEIRITFRTV